VADLIYLREQASAGELADATGRPNVVSRRYELEAELIPI